MKISCFWFNPSEFNEDRIAIYVHGGSFAAGSIASHRALVSHIADAMKDFILLSKYQMLE